MLKIQLDDTDIIARELTPTMVKLVRSVQNEFSSEDRKKQDQLLEHLESWNGRFNEKSISGSIYTFTVMNLYESWLQTLMPGDHRKNDRMLIMDCNPFNDFI